MINALEVHPSFWAKQYGFATWRFLRCNPRYAEWLAKITKGCSIHIDRIQQTGVARYFKDHPPRKPTETYEFWRRRVIQESPITSEELSRVTADLRALHDFFKPKRTAGVRTLPDNWLPIPHRIEFPHPYMLDRLTPSSIGCAVIRLSERDRNKEPFIDLGEVEVGRSAIPYPVDYLNRQPNEICAEILAQIPSRSKATQKEITADVTRQLQLLYGQKRSRDRKTRDGHLIHAIVVRAMEIYISHLGGRPFMKLNDLSPIERKKALDVVAKELFPIDYLDVDKRKAALQRLRHYIKKAYDTSDGLIP